ncbi:MAG: hypothetical protein CMO01_25000 [Thalassobius sp.]|nr:hypothetical protein [Thalassovita sp.]
MFRKYADQIGISGSIICLLHCVFFPLLGILGTSAATGVHDHEHIFLGDDFLFVLIGIIAVYYAAKNTPNRKIKLSLWFFIGLFSVSLITSESIETYSWLTYLSHISAAGLVITHAYNFIKIRKLSHCSLSQC